MKHTFAKSIGLAAALTICATLAMAGGVKDVLKSASFEGASGHATTGDVQVVSTKDGRTLVILGDNFTFDGAPDPQISFGKGGAHDASTLMGKLQANSGTQTYEVPAGVDPADFSEVYVFCVKYNVPLGVAKF